MKKSHLKQFIKEEIRSVLQESINEAKEKWVVYDTKTKKRLPNAGKTWVTMKAADAFAAKQKNAKVASAEFYFDKIQESINESKKYTKGDKLHVKLKSGKEFDVVFDSYSSTDGIAFGRIDGETKPFSLNAVVESVNEAKNPQYITDQEQADKVVATLLKQGKTKEWIKSNIGRNRTELKFIGRALKAVTESIDESKYRVEYTTQDGEKAKSRVYNSEEEAEKKEKQLVDTSGIKQAKIVKVEESINEDQFEASLSDPKKYKMGTMWFKRWMKPKKEQDGWTWEDDGRYIWLTRPDMNKPTVRFEKETGLLQGNWKDPMEMQWE